MKNILQYIEEEKYYLKDTKEGKRWYSIKNRGLYDKPAPVFTHEELIKKYESKNNTNT